jgi:predicted translin family RNA/ssDNA-binding protein
MEAMAFQYYLENQSLMPIEDARAKVATMTESEDIVMLTEADYVLGVFDMVGELMRFAITSMATGARVVVTDEMDTTADGPQRTVLSDLRELRSYLELLDPSGSSMARDYGKKMQVMQECVEKVEKASYGQIVRGSERPTGWVPDLEDRREEVEAA